MPLQENKWINGFLKIPETHKPLYYCLLLMAGLFAFLGIIAVFLRGGIVEREELIIFVLGWLIVPVFAVLTIILVNRMVQKYFPDPERLLWALIAFNGLLFTILTTSLNLFQYSGKSATWIHLLVYTAVLTIPLANGLIIPLMKRGVLNFSIDSLQRLSLLGCLGFINFLSLFPDPEYHYQTPLSLLLIALAGSTFITLIKRNAFPTFNNHLIILGLDIFISLIIILACLDPAFYIDLLHQNFYLGPANRILHGGTMLVDTFSQYGVLVIYFISFVFKNEWIPFTYQGLSLVVAVLFILHFIMIYLLLIALVKQRLYAILLFSAILLLNFFGTSGIIQAYPSTGPLRFELAYLVLTMVYIRKRFKFARWWGQFIEFSLIGIASLWSFETFIYCAFPYLGICLYESISQYRSLRLSIQSFIRRILWFFFALTVSQSIFALLTFQQSGKLPDWITYLSFINTYSVGEFGTVLIAPWGPWFFIISIYFAALAAFLFRFIVHKDLDDSPESVFLFGLTLVGIAFFTYFLGRSHPNNLYHISTPAVILTGYGYVQLRRAENLPKVFHTAAKFIFSSAVILVLLILTPVFWGKVQQDHTGFRMTAKSIYSIVRGGSPNIWGTEQDKLQQGSGDNQVREAVALIQKYTQGENDVTIFLSPLNTTEILMRSDRLHHFPISDVVEDSVSGKIAQDLLEYPHGLKENSFIFLAQDPRSYQNNLELNKLQIGIIAKLCQEFRFNEVESTPEGVAAVRLQPLSGAQTPYCEIVRSIRDNEIP